MYSLLSVLVGKLFSFVTATVTFGVMYADCISADWASMGLFLAFQELIHAFGFNHFEVFNHAHPVMFPITLIQMF
jgi:hypothetical protein